MTTKRVQSVKSNPDQPMETVHVGDCSNQLDRQIQVHKLRLCWMRSNALLWKSIWWLPPQKRQDAGRESLLVISDYIVSFLWNTSHWCPITWSKGWTFWHMSLFGFEISEHLRQIHQAPTRKRRLSCKSDNGDSDCKKPWSRLASQGMSGTSISQVPFAMTNRCCRLRQRGENASDSCSDTRGKMINSTFSLWILGDKLDSNCHLQNCSHQASHYVNIQQFSHAIVAPHPLQSAGTIIPTRQRWQRIRKRQQFFSLQSCYINANLA